MTRPSENRSARASTSSPRACSGDMKLTLPFTTPCWVRVTRPSAFTMPKSNSFTSPRAVTRMLLGETSRWTMPSADPLSPVRLWAYSRASSTSWAACRTAATGMPAPVRCLRCWVMRPRSRPRMYSVAWKYSSPTLPKSSTGTMFECTRLLARLASSMKLDTTVWSSRYSGRSRLITNLRRKPSAPNTTAVYTWDMPPSPRRSTRT